MPELPINAFQEIILSMNLTKLTCGFVVIFIALSSFIEFAANADLIDEVEAVYPGIPQAAVTKAFNYYDEHPSLVTNKNYITIIDFDQPSNNERMYVIDMKTQEVSTYLVAHGKNSGELYATQFSNAAGSYMSSLGIYLTGAQFDGSDGVSMRLLGEESTNSNALAREIVVHGATYVSKQFIEQNGRLGRSEGCPAVETQYASNLITKLEGGSVYLIYYSGQ